MVAKTDMIRARMEHSLKEHAEAIFSQLGLSTTDAITLFYYQVVLNDGLPFQVRLPNKATRDAMAEAKAGKGLVKSSLKELRSTYK